MYEFTDLRSWAEFFGISQQGIDELIAFGCDDFSDLRFVYNDDTLSDQLKNILRPADYRKFKAAQKHTKVLCDDVNAYARDIEEANDEDLVTTGGKARVIRRTAYPRDDGYGTDIGHFGVHENSPGIALLSDIQMGDDTWTNPQLAREDVMLLVAEVRNSYRPKCNTIVKQQPVCRTTNMLKEVECQALRDVLDKKTDDKQGDFKYNLSYEELCGYVDASQVQKISTMMNGDFDKIILRRCAAHGLCINFHLDFAVKTLQVSLNGDDEYVGGRLVYALDDGLLYVPKRPIGTVTVHDQSTVHGVSTLRCGVRYGLFFIKEATDINALTDAISYLPYV